MTGDVESFMLYKEMNQYGVNDHPDSLQGRDEEIAPMDEQEL